MNIYNFIEGLIFAFLGTWYLRVFFKSKNDKKVLDKFSLPGTGKLFKYRATYLIGSIILYLGALFSFLR